MYDLLEAAENDGFEDVISWLPGGKAFKIHSRLAFETKVMPVYFPSMTSYKSFRRQLNLYGIYQDRSMLNAPDNCKYLSFFLSIRYCNDCNHVIGDTMFVLL